MGNELRYLMACQPCALSCSAISARSSGVESRSMLVTGRYLVSSAAPKFVERLIGRLADQVPQRNFRSGGAAVIRAAQFVEALGMKVHIERIGV